MDQHRVLTLQCVNCGGKLEISPDMQRFACGYCGTEQLVERRGGTVALKGVEEAISRVQVGTDKTAAELAIPRLEKELEDIVKARKRVAADANGGAGVGCIVGVMVFFGAAAIAAQQRDEKSKNPIMLIGLIVAIVVGIGVAMNYNNSNKAGHEEALSRLELKENEIRRKIARNKEIANS